jgi:hypothetical protein
MLVEIEGEWVRIFAGLSLRARLVQVLGPVRALRVAQAVARMGGPVLGVDWGRRRVGSSGQIERFEAPMINQVDWDCLICNALCGGLCGVGCALACVIICGPNVVCTPICGGMCGGLCGGGCYFGCGPFC